jgi:hypothetical protein
MKGESTAVPGDRAWIDDLANEVALLVVVVKGEEHGLTGVPLFDQPSHVHVAFRDQLGVAGDRMAQGGSLRRLPRSRLLLRHVSRARGLCRAGEHEQQLAIDLGDLRDLELREPLARRGSGGRNCHVWRSPDHVGLGCECAVSCVPNRLDLTLNPCLTDMT